jgi:hypothetical protein
VRVSNPASNPELLDELAKRFTEYNYGFRRLIRDICTSRTYQLSTRANDTNAGDTRNFARAASADPRGSVARLRRAGDGAAGEVRGPSAGRAGGADRRRQPHELLPDDLRPGQARDGVLVRGEDGAQPLAGPAPAQRRHRERKGERHPVIPAMLKAKLPPEQMVEQLYVRCLSRKPTAQELETVATAEGARRGPKQVLTDLFWALLNSQEFMFNH